jgi:TnpA family transposase
MPRRTLFSPAEREALFALPATEGEWLRYYTLADSDLAVIAQRRGGHNRLGFAVQLCYLRYPGFVLQPDESPAPELLAFVAKQLRIDPKLWLQYAHRAQTRREHLAELQSWLNLKLFGSEHTQQFVDQLVTLAQQTDQGFSLALALVEALRKERVLLPTIDVIERLCAEGLTRGTRQVYETLTLPLLKKHRLALDLLLANREKSKISLLFWLRQPPRSPKPKHILLHIERLKIIQELNLPDEAGRTVHQNWLRKLAGEGGRMTTQHLIDLEESRRYATMVAVVLDTRATLIDEIIDLHDRILGTLFSRAKRQHAEQFQQSGRSINDQLRLYTRIGNALLEAKETGGDAFTAIEAVLPWEAFRESVSDTQKLTRSESFDYLPLIGDGFAQLRRYTPSFLEVLSLKAAPSAQDILLAIGVLKTMNLQQLRKVPEGAPVSFVRKRWESLVRTADGIDRRFYELCVLSELRNALRSGDVWVAGSRQFKDFEEYLLPQQVFLAQRKTKELGLPVEIDCEQFLAKKLSLLERGLKAVERLAAQNELPDAMITQAGLKVTPLDKAVPEAAEALMRQVYLPLPHLKITELLLEVDKWTGFTRHFTHLKSGEPVTDKRLLLTAILADAINLGLTKMAESCPGTTYAKLSWLQAWHIRDETYSEALAELVNAVFRHPFGIWWGDGTTSSSDGQNFKAGGRGHFAGQVNLKYGTEPGVQFYTHISDQYAPFYTKVINATVRDATHVLDGLLYHESELQIKEHYTDTAGFTDHVFALMQMLGFRFAPRIRDLADKRIYIHTDAKLYPTLSCLIGGSVNLSCIRTHWDEVLRLAASIKQGTVTASLMLRKLGSYPRQNGLAIALRELGRLERTLFTLDWLQSVELRRRVQIGLNKGEAKNALARAVFFNRLGELRDRRFENQRYRASGLNLVVAAIVVWNTTYLERSVKALRENNVVEDDLLQYLSPLGWEHINLTGDYVWNLNKKVENGDFRSLRRSIENP